MMKERTLRVLEFTKIRDRLASKAMTDMGRERCEALVPSSNMTEIQRMQAETEEAALALAWEREGRREFNHCPRCGRYVSSAMFNVNAECCIDCAPWEDEYPAFCHHCGHKLSEADARFCPRCGARLLVGGTDGERGESG